jgi:hypothetical protein
MSLFDWADTESSAYVSDCGRYRYTLARRWASGPAATFVMLNPSVADATRNDPTISRCIKFARSWGMGAIAVVNLYALISTDPAGLFLEDDPVGPDNDTILRRYALGATGPVIAAWGANARQDRVDEVRALPGMDQLQCLGTTLAGAPKHPLARGRHRIPDDVQLRDWPGVAA